ncbi:MAG: hypothetical protein FWF63_07090 [Fibromonadales bacterium]|nr:hypothetical protein [Fibromonadales bacterium]
MPRLKRLRIFAGPNGSGKTTLYYYLTNKRKVFKNYCFINADEITKKLKESLDLKVFPIKISRHDLSDFLKTPAFPPKLTKPLSEYLNVQGYVLTLKDKNLSRIDYISASIAEFLRKKILSNSSSSFAFETVLSHKSKLVEISNAKKCGYKIYLYVVSTSHPDINKKRVQMREKMGGHSVPLEKIKKRYHRCLNNIYDAMLLADRAFFFDNSGKKHSFIAQKFVQKEYKGLFLESNLPTPWFNKYILDKILKKNKF